MTLATLTPFAINSAAIMLVALALEILIGWPGWLFAAIRHPVTWVGGLIDLLDRILNRAAWPDTARRLAGLATALVVAGMSGAIAWFLASILPGGIAGVLAGGILAWPLVATRSMHDHVTAVAGPLSAGDLEGARQAVAMIVGRDPAQLDQAGIARAALESLAENTSDGIVAPVFWGVLFGLPGIAAYKAINTLDSMIGHRTERYHAFGWASARIDDVANWIPARLTGLLIAAVSTRPGLAMSCMTRHAKHHRSPNAGWPEAAMAGALGIRLSGPRRYTDKIADEPWLNGDADDPKPADLRLGIVLFRRTILLLGVLVALTALIP